MKKTYKAPKTITTEKMIINIIAASGPQVLTDPMDPEAAEGRSLTNFDSEKDDS